MVEVYCFGVYEIFYSLLGWFFNLFWGGLLTGGFVTFSHVSIIRPCLSLLLSLLFLFILRIPYHIILVAVLIYFDCEFLDVSIVLR